MVPVLSHPGGGFDDLEADKRGREAGEGVVVEALRLPARGGPKQMVYEDAPLPAPAAGEAPLRVYAAGITRTELTWSEAWHILEQSERPAVVGHGAFLLTVGACHWRRGSA